MGYISYEDITAMTAHRADAAAVHRVIEALDHAASISLNAAVARRLDAYAALLGERGRHSQAEEVAAQAAKMHEADQARREAEQAFREGRSYDTSLYLGFMPDRTLGQYAAELRRLGRDADAADAATLAAEYRKDQARAVDALWRQQSRP